MMPNARPPKILIVGIDGATFSLITPWAESGELPTISRLMQNGAWGDLDSTIPPLTAPAWTSFMTGKNPGKHSLYHFISPRPGTYDFEYTNATTRKSRTIWRILSDRGITVGVVNLPMTYPPEEINGFMISGLGTPDASSPFIYPTSLRHDLLKDFGPVKLDIIYLESMRSDPARDAVLNEMASIEDHRADLALHLTRTFPVEIFMIVFGSVDQIQHYFWHYMDGSHYRYDVNQAKKYGDAILKAYRKIDDKLKDLLATVSDDTTILLMSDHGAGPSSDSVVHLNQYLSEIGVLQFQKTIHTSFLSSLIQRADPFLRRTLSPRQKAKLASLLPQIRKKWERKITSLSAIDWSRTQAFCYDILPTYANIWVNLKGKFPQGVVDPGNEYNDLIEFLYARLSDLRDPTTGNKIVKGIFRKSEIYSGPHTDLAPDLVLSWWEDDTFMIRPSSATPGGASVRKLGTSLDRLINQSGTHRSQGVFLFHGRPFSRLHIADKTRIVDLAPTLLYLMGCPIPTDMDGRVIDAAFTKEYLASHPIRYCDPPHAASEEQNHVETYSTQDAAIVRERLRALGYME